MTVKRTELEILEKAISLADDRGRRIAHLEVMTLNSPTMCAIKKPILKKGDTKKQREYYEEKIRIEVENCKSEMKYEKGKEILIEEITGLNQQIDLLRWLYKDNSEVTND
jgi:hypothetical protein